eukprot:7795183-Pyramimonas_sp.AAC.1
MTLASDNCADDACARPLTIVLNVDAVRVHEAGLRGEEHGNKEMMTGTGEARLRGEDHGHKDMT